MLLSLSLCLILFSLSLPHRCSGSSSLSPYLLLSVLITLCCFIFLPPPTIPFFLYFCLVPTICHPLSSSVTPTASPPLIFTPSIQFRELYWHHKMNFTVSASLSGTFVFLLLILYSFNAAPQNSAAPCTSCTSHGQVSLQH